jgi:hypothetical protein
VKAKPAPAIVLVVLASILPETLTGNTPALVLFKPGPFLFFMIAYGLPVLLIREFAVRCAIGTSGLFVIGLGYGIINEALIATTVFRNAGVPVDVFDGYSFAAGIQWAWVGFILPWHALSSVILPIVFSHLAVPAAALRPWLGVRFTWSVALVLIGLISFFYLYEDTSGIAGTWPMLAMLWGLIAALGAGACFLPAQPLRGIPGQPRWKLVLLGYSGFIPLQSLLVISGARWPFWIYLGAVLFWITLFRFLTRRFASVNAQAFGWFGLGWYLQIGMFSWISVAAQMPYMVAVDLTLLALLWWILHRAESARP